MMTEHEIRLKCLELAVARMDRDEHISDVLREADDMASFSLHGTTHRGDGPKSSVREDAYAMAARLVSDTLEQQGCTLSEFGEARLRQNIFEAIEAERCK